MVSNKRKKEKETLGDTLETRWMKKVKRDRWKVKQKCLKKKR
jgi:hypothetical protein